MNNALVFPGQRIRTGQSKRLWLFQAAQLLVPFLLIGLIHYNTNQIVDAILSLFLFIAFLNSKRNSYWLAFFFLLVNPFGGVFSGEHPLIVLPAWGRGILFSEAFAVVAFLKALVTPSRLSYKHFRIPGLILLVNILMSIPTTLVFGVSAYSFLLIMRNCIHVLYLFAFPRLLSTDEEWGQFFNFLYIIVIAIFVNVMLEQLLHFKLAFLMGASSVGSGFGEILYGGDETLRFSNSANIALIALLSSLCFLASGNRRFPRVFLIANVFIVYFLTLMSATRGWILSLSFILFFSVLFNLRKMVRFGTVVFLVVLLIVANILILNSPRFASQYENMLYRMSTLQLLAEGDLTAGGTLQRLTFRFEWVQQGIALNPMFGVGFSQVFIKHFDPHTGNLNFILQGGYLGLVCWILAGLAFAIILLHKAVSLPPENPYRSYFLICFFFFIGLVIIHSSSVMLFFYTTRTGHAYSIYMFLAYCFYTMNQADKYTAAMLQKVEE